MIYKPLQQKAYEYIKEKIVSGEMEPGVIYSETKTASEIGISRTPLKDALTRLSQDRYIDIIPSKGFVLHTMTDEDIINTYQIRIAIESFCAVSLYESRNSKAGKALISQLKFCIDQMESCVRDNGSIDEFLISDFTFHRIMIESVKNDEINNMMESFYHRQHGIAERSLKTSGRFRKAIDEHKAIIAAIEMEDSNAIQQIYTAVKEHMLNNSAIAACNDLAFV